MPRLLCSLTLEGIISRPTYMPDDIKYPDISLILDNVDRHHCQELFDELCALTVTKNVAQERIDEVKLELDRYQDILDAKGIQHNGYVYTHECYAEGRRSLSPLMLMEQYGVSKAVIDACYVRGKPYERRTLRPLSEGKEVKKGGPEDDPL